MQWKVHFIVKQVLNIISLHNYAQAMRGGVQIVVLVQKLYIKLQQNEFPSNRNYGDTNMMVSWFPTISHSTLLIGKVIQKFLASNATDNTYSFV